MNEGESCSCARVYSKKILAGEKRGLDFRGVYKERGYSGSIKICTSLG